jgi:hypothetical protein
MQGLHRVLQYAKIIIQIFFNRHILSLKRFLLLAHKSSKRCPSLLISVDVNKHTSCLLAKDKDVRISINYCLLHKFNVCRLCILCKRL